jgi:hypothetical protein
MLLLMVDSKGRKVSLGTDKMREVRLCAPPFS